ncbi:MAG TPA: alpha-ketoglutarate-dependent dioxygenase AlkB [Vicinamibacterales bacterium]|nr:alpha-ketoglutarate-dependent dioxygenase AlkB [Vicinamibacterales bacterium]
MSQPTLFEVGETHERVLVDEGRGRVIYTPDFVDADTAAAWFEELRRDVAWRAERRMMYEREVDVPRLVASFRLDSADDREPEPEHRARAIPRSIVEASRRVGNHLAIPFNSAGLNFYRDGRDSVAPHNDHLNELQKGFPIALLSLGSTRRMTIRAKEPPRRAVHVDLDPGSLLVMEYATQLHYTHGVPKTNDRVGERISVAFRVKRPPRADSRGSFYDK